MEKVNNLMSNDKSYSGIEDEYIYALAPKQSTESNEEVDVNSTPAIQSLDELVNQGKISGAKAAHLKSKYQELVEQLKRIRDMESKYLHKGKELTHIVQKQQNDLERSELFPVVEDNEVNRLRFELLKYGNELAACNDRIYHLDFKMEGLQEERRLLQRDFERLPKKEEVEKTLNNANQDIEDLKIEIAQRIHECQSLNEEKTSKQKENAILTRNMEALEIEEQDLKDQLVKKHSEPTHISKQAELIARQHRDALEKYKQFEADIAEVDKELNKISTKKNALLEEKDGLSRTLESYQYLYEEKDREIELLTKECELAKEREVELLGDRTSLDLNLKHAFLEKKSEHEMHSRKVREKDRALRNLKKAELQLQVITDALSHTKSVRDKIQSQAEAQPTNNGILLEKRVECQREVDNAKRAFDQQNALTIVEKQKAEKGVSEEERLISEQGQLRIDIADLTRLAQIKADEREQKARDYLKAELRYHTALEDLKTNDIAIEDHSKKYGEIQKRLDDFAKLYDVIKNERNKCVNLIQTSTQRAAEMREKIKILQNEIEILRSAALAKERQVQKAKLKHSNGVVIRDSLRNEVSKQQVIAEDLNEQMEQQRLAISKLNELINKAEENMIELRRKYETSVQERNKRGIHLIERNEEVCVLYEKVNVQGSILRNGDMELHSREDEIRFLQMEAADLKRVIGLLRASLPNKKYLDNELTTMQIQLAQCQEHISRLERKFENSSDGERMRLLDGDDLSLDELVKKNKELEKRLALKEEQLLEKDLIQEQVTRLTDRLKSRSEIGKDDTLLLAKKVNEVQSKIKETTRKMMAMISELSMNQALAMKLQQEKEQQKETLRDCYVRMEQGEPPTGEIQKEWLKSCRDELKRIKDMNDRAKKEETIEQYTLSSGLTTTAEPRPNAYIPDEENELPLPRPYGRNAPFKPTSLGSNMRHIRKPVVKPIEI